MTCFGDGNMLLGKMKLTALPTKSDYSISRLIYQEKYELDEILYLLRYKLRQSFKPILLECGYSHYRGNSVIILENNAGIEAREEHNV